MHLENVLLHPVESYRTSPIGYNAVLTGIGITASETRGFDSPPPGNEKNLWLYFALTTTIGGILAIRKHGDIRERLEDSIGKHGFDERLFRPVVATWCGRQAAFTACRNSGVVEQYQEFISAYVGPIQYKNIPNF